jgi:hypothetical protein
VLDPARLMEDIRTALAETRMDSPIEKELRDPLVQTTDFGTDLPANCSYAEP